MSRAIKRYGTPAARASAPNAPMQPPRRFTQSELRDRRRAGLSTAHYSGEWSLAAEIAAVCHPLARRVATAPRPARFRQPVGELADAVHEAASTIIGWVAENDAMRRTAHLRNEPGKRRNAVRALCDLAQRPALPQITTDMLTDGSWAASVVAMAQTVDGPLSELLGRAHAPGSNALRGQPSRSERLDRLLRGTIDLAALELRRKLDWSESQPPPPPAKSTDPRAELARLGITTD
jgi:hypothetical protein